MSATIVGTTAIPVWVEVDVLKRGFPGFTIVGLANKAISEAKERVRSAIVNSNFKWPEARITVNLAPADLPKNGTGFDLPIALGILLASNDFPGAKNMATICAMGELSLNGSIQAIPGVLPALTLFSNTHFKTIVIPQGNSVEASIAETPVCLQPTLKAAFETLTSTQIPLDLPRISFFKANSTKQGPPELYGLEAAKRVAAIALIGGHHLHLFGPPGTGKTSLAHLIQYLSPNLTNNEVKQVACITSISEIIKAGSVSPQKPFRSPHHSSSAASILGTLKSPGEITKAHNGILFLDEFTEFRREVLEGLRIPLEQGTFTVGRSNGSVQYPCKFQLIAASNPCPCGYYGSNQKQCTCSSGQLQNYRRKLSGPILDRIDLHLKVEPAAIYNSKGNIPLVDIEKSIETGINTRKRFGILNKVNSELSASELKQLGIISPEVEATIVKIQNKLLLSQRSILKTIRIALSIANMSGSINLSNKNILEAVQYRWNTT